MWVETATAETIEKLERQIKQLEAKLESERAQCQIIAAAWLLDDKGLRDMIDCLQSVVEYRAAEKGGDDG